jgi:hypothetical protein
MMIALQPLFSGDSGKNGRSSLPFMSARARRHDAPLSSDYVYRATTTKILCISEIAPAIALRLSLDF